MPKGMYQIARIEFQKCNFLVRGAHPPSDTSLSTQARNVVLVLHVGHCLYSTSPSRGKAVLDLPLFVICTIHVLLLFLECASRLEHVGLNKYFWHIYKVTMTCFTTRHIQRGGGGGGGGWGQHFSTLRAPKLMTHWAPRVFDLLDTPLQVIF